MSQIPDHNDEAALHAALQQAVTDRSPLALRGSGSKDFYGPACAPPVTDLDLTRHSGVVAYEPTELAITVRAGTPLAALEALLAEHDQQLSFEPPHFGPKATVGGMAASGLSGPRRVAAGAVRDALLGVRLINGHGQVLEFGGRVMKNVAGYDLSRLMAGSMGTLGVLLELSFKVLPRAAHSTTLAFELDSAAALQQLTSWAGQALPISASSYHAGRLQLRLEGGSQGVQAAIAQIGAELDKESVKQPQWNALREQRLAWFDDPRPLWRLSLPPASPWVNGLASDDTDWLLEWNGALRWLKSDAAAADIRQQAAALGGHATLFRAAAKPSGSEETPAFTPLTATLADFHRQLKLAMDPHRLLNPGRLYADL